MSKNPATWSLVGLCVLFFILAEFLGGSTNPAVLSQLGARRSLMGFPEENWRLLASCLLHFGWLHLLANTVVLAFCGTFLEPRIAWWRVLFLFIWGGWSANLVAAEYQRRGLAVGASGAAMAFVGCLLMLLFWAPREFKSKDRLGLRVSTILTVLLVLFPMRPLPFVDHAAHQAGLVFGSVYWIGLHFTRRRNAGYWEAVLLLATLFGSLSRGPTLGL